MLAVIVNYKKHYSDVIIRMKRDELAVAVGEDSSSSTATIIPWVLAESPHRAFHRSSLYVS